MKVLLIGPNHQEGSLSPYVRDLYNTLKEIINIDWIGSSSLPYRKAKNSFFSLDEVLKESEKLFQNINYEEYDFILLHYGRLEIEQLAPIYIPKNKKIIYFVHHLEWDLFKTFIPSNELYSKVKEQIASYSALIFFGNFAKEFCQYSSIKFCVLKYPAFIKLNKKKLSNDNIILSHIGYASPWKNFESFFDILKDVKKPCNLNICGPQWNLFFDKEIYKIGNSKVQITSDYFTYKKSKDILEKSAYGIFPYFPVNGFQGSGAICNYLYNNIPALYYDTANLDEIVEGFGIQLNPQDSKESAELLDEEFMNSKLKWNINSSSFSIDSHCSKLINFLLSL